MFVQCKSCEGRGFFIPKGLTVAFICNTCEGKGGFDIPPNTQLCPKCNGTGSVTEYVPEQSCDINSICNECDGRGFVYK